MYKEIGFKSLKEWIFRKKDIQIVDVREPYEFNAGHIKGAKLMPLGSLRNRISELDRKKPVVFVCRSGSRSGMATRFADALGFDAYNLEGGMLESEKYNF